MAELTQDDLLEKYPKIFSQKDGSVQGTAMCWGISTGPGWYPIIDGLCATIQNIVDNENQQRKREMMKEDVTEDMDVSDYPDLSEYELDDPARVEATQVKEKFGGLRFYVIGKGYISEKAWNEVHGAIWMAEKMSLRICEQCGTTKGVDLRGESWVKTLCLQCWHNRG